MSLKNKSNQTFDLAMYDVSHQYQFYQKQRRYTNWTLELLPSLTSVVISLSGYLEDLKYVYFIDLKGRAVEGETEREWKGERSPICWLTSQVVTIARTGSCGSQKLRTLRGFPGLDDRGPSTQVTLYRPPSAISGKLDQKWSNWASSPLIWVPGVTSDSFNPLYHIALTIFDVKIQISQEIMLWV